MVPFARYSMPLACGNFGGLIRCTDPVSSYRILSPKKDIYSPAPSIEPSLSAADFFNGKTATLKLVSLADGSSVTGASVSTGSFSSPASFSSESFSSPSSGASPLTGAPSTGPSPGPGTAHQNIHRLSPNAREGNVGNARPEPRDFFPCRGQVHVPACIGCLTSSLTCSLWFMKVIIECRP